MIVVRPVEAATVRFVGTGSVRAVVGPDGPIVWYGCGGSEGRIGLGSRLCRGSHSPMPLLVCQHGRDVVCKRIPCRATVVYGVAGQRVEDGSRVARDALVTDLTHDGREGG